uniref:Uncharacterized protein n=1 Tax=Attheya septentrionalis TaxID=420275 RepID=A0A7S2XPU5_9STRA|mmetsp:Transcript_26124/g.47392  ORF Transcript_26124/g.47392 Transcript_26124/m.47392 type:complete len:177 (+) Transcript_26124:117-647(+)
MMEEPMSFMSNAEPISMEGDDAIYNMGDEAEAASSMSPILKEASASVAGGDGDGDDDDADDDDSELTRLKRECAAMVHTLENLQTEEASLKAQNKILAREAIICGYRGTLLMAPAKRRKLAAAAASVSVSVSASTTNKISNIKAAIGSPVIHTTLAKSTAGESSPSSPIKEMQMSP